LFSNLINKQLTINLDKKLTPKLAFAGSLLYILYFSATTVLNHINFATHSLDYGIFDHVFYNLSRFKGSYTTLHFKNQLLEEHFSPILYFYVPVYILFLKSPFTLLVVQSLSLGISSWIIYLLVYKKTQNTYVSLALSLSFLLHPALHGVNLYDYHESSLIPPLVLTCLYYYQANKIKMYKRNDNY
jgi:uncharacterized membrane protein